jgi:hypothetical protein
MLMNVRMAMRSTVVRVRMRMDDEVFRIARIARIARPTPQETRSDSAHQRGESAEAKQDQHHGDGKFHRETKPRRDGDFKNDYRSADRKHGYRVPEAPCHADTGGRGETALAAEDGCHRDYVIGVGRMAHPEQQSEQRDSQRCGIAKVHCLSFPGVQRLVIDPAS